MSKLLTDRLSVIRQNRLRQVFSSCLIYALKGVEGITKEGLSDIITEVEYFSEKPNTYIRFQKFKMKMENKDVWLQALADGVYSFTLFEKLRSAMLPIMEHPKTELSELWDIYVRIYARQLLKLSAKTLCCPENGFNQQTVRYFITHPESVHGEELINNIPPLLEKGYIYLNNCGENQQTEWHRNIFTDSCFVALMSYQNIFKPNDIARAFNCF